MPADWSADIPYDVLDVVINPNEEPHEDSTPERLVALDCHQIFDDNLDPVSPEHDPEALLILKCAHLPFLHTEQLVVQHLCTSILVTLGTLAGTANFNALAALI